MVITIDGPVASGKSSVARSIAQRLGFYYLNSGLLYRAAAYIALQMSEDLTGADSKKITDFVYDYHQGQPRIMYKKQDITDKLYTDQISAAASQISSQKNLRDALIDMQRSLAQKYNLVTDGRDCGSVIFPEADAKFYLTADVKVRALRLFNDPKRKQKKRAFEEVVAQVQARDQRDQKRSVAPLVIPQGAMVIDNGYLTEQETIELFLAQLDKKGLH